MDRKEAIERIQEVMTIIRTQHICKDMDGECTEEDRKAYIQRFEALRMAIEALQEPERKKGQWIILSSNEDSAVCKCSVCGEDFVFYEGEFFPNYCGDCGSDMRGEKKMNRELDGVYFRVQRNEKWQSICFSDLTEEEREKVCEGRSAEWFKSLAYHLADCIKEIGEQFDIIAGEQNE